MTTQPQQYQTSPPQIAKYIAQTKLNDSFKKGSLLYFSFFSGDITNYLMDYFILLDDLRLRMSPSEEIRKCYSEYSFVVVPVHKALESYIKGFLSYLMSYRVSKKKGETLGYYLHLSDEKKTKRLEFVQKEGYPWKETKTKISMGDWVTRWNGLCAKWSDDRNPLIHPEEKIETLREAEQVAGSILREINLSLQLFIKEALKPGLDLEKGKIEESKKITPQS